VAAILRRVTGLATDEGRIRLADVVLDEATRLATLSGEPVHLTPTEFDLVVALARRRGAVRTREQLLFDVWGYRDGSGVRTVDSHVRALRRKLGGDVIRTVHGVGYAVGNGDG
jgi:DNA-binding response OmpR family regulator